MKFAFLAFGALGFAIVAVAGMSAGRAPDLVLRDAALGCLVMAIAGRRFWRVLDRAFAETIAARRATAEAEAAQAAAAPSSAPAKPVPARTPAPASSTR